MEGLFFESSLTTPFHFLNASEVSYRPSNPVRGLNYRGMDFERAVEHLDLYGVQHYISFTEEAREAAIAAGLPVVAEPSPWTVFDLRRTEAVVPLAYEPVVYAGRSISDDPRQAVRDFAAVLSACLVIHVCGGQAEPKNVQRI